MTSPQRPHESLSDDKEEGNAPQPMAEPDSPMGRFKTLARKVLAVSRAELKEQERQYERQRSMKRNPMPTSD
jgi:hypothetical protein